MLEHEIPAAHTPNIADLRLTAKMDGEPQGVILELVDDLGDPDALEDDLFIFRDTPETAIKEAVMTYNNDFVCPHKGENPSLKTKLGILKDETAEFETSPLLAAAIEVVNLYPSRRNHEVEAIVRLLYKRKTEIDVGLREL